MDTSPSTPQGSPGQVPSAQQAPPAPSSFGLQAPQVAWHSKPGPSLAVGLALLAVCAVCLFLWISTGFFVARWIGYLSGASGILFTYGAVNGFREGRS